MIARFLGGHRRLLFRTYLYLLAGVALIALALRFGLDQLRGSSDTEIDPWVQSTVALVEAQIGRLPATQRESGLSQLSTIIGLPVVLLPFDEVAIATPDANATRRLVDDEGQTFYLHRSERLQGMLYFGPVTQSPTNPLFDWAPTLFYAAVFVLIGVWLRPILRDIDIISHAATRFSSDYRQPTDAAARTRELTMLAEQVDAMSARLSGLIQSQKELIAALSHEMRTPLARIRFALAIIEDSAENTQPSQLAGIKQDLDEVESLVGTMLDYARLDHPDLAMHRQDIDVSAFLESLDTDGGPTEKTVAVANTGKSHVNADARLLTLAASNLLSNARRHARAQVRLSIDASGDACLLRVEDDGDGVPAEDRDTIFKAFTRLDNSRTRDTGGYGLGLAIVARIAALHGGTASVDQSPALGGARFTLAWPRPASVA